MLWLNVDLCGPYQSSPWEHYDLELHCLGCRASDKRGMQEIFFMPPPFSMGVWGLGVGAYSITGVHMYVRPILSIPYVTNGFHSISFEKISILDSNFIHRYIVMKCRSSSNEGKIHQLLWELWPFFKL